MPLASGARGGDNKRGRNATMHRAAIVVVAALIAPPLAAEPRLSALGQTCQALHREIARAGASLVEFAPGAYERIVRDGSACLPGQTTQPWFTRSRDEPVCMPGFICIQIELETN
jgi:hypothetical protein